MLLIAVSLVYLPRALVQNKVTATEVKSMSIELKSIEFIGVLSFLIGCALHKQKNLSPNLTLPLITASMRYMVKVQYKIVAKKEVPGVSSPVKISLRKGVAETPLVFIRM
jgi:hypothetical protein